MKLYLTTTLQNKRSDSQVLGLPPKGRGSFCWWLGSHPRPPAPQQFPSPLEMKRRPSQHIVFCTDCLPVFGGAPDSPVNHAFVHSVTIVLVERASPAWCGCLCSWGRSQVHISFAFSSLASKKHSCQPLDPGPVAWSLKGQIRNGTSASVSQRPLGMGNSSLVFGFLIWPEICFRTWLRWQRRQK